MGWKPEVLHILRRFLSTYVYYIIHDCVGLGASPAGFVLVGPRFRRFNEIH